MKDRERERLTGRTTVRSLKELAAERVGQMEATEKAIRHQRKQRAHRTKATAPDE